MNYKPKRISELNLKTDMNVTLIGTVEEVLENSFVLNDGEKIEIAAENVPEKGNTSPQSLRLLRPSIVVLCGPAACGKSTFAQRHFRPTQIISSDWARAHICDDERDQRFNAQAFLLVHFVVEQRLAANRLCVVDSTALTPQARKDLLDLARKYQVPATLLVFSVPLSVCLERDQKRERSVGSAVIERQHRAFEEAKATLGQEGFDQVVEIPDEAAEKVQIEILFRPVMRSAQRPEVGAPRRFERSGQLSRPHPGGHGDNGHPGVAVPPAGPRGAAPRPAAPPGSVPTPKEAIARPAGTPSQTAGAQNPSPAQPAASSPTANKPSSPPPAGLAPNPAPPAAPGPASSEPETPSGG